MGETIIGIDLGTTNALVAVADERGPRVLEASDGQRMLPSVLRLDEATGSIAAIGTPARERAVEFPQQTIFSVKRLMGRGLEDVRDELAYLPYDVVAGPRDTARVRVGEHLKSPQELSAHLLAELKRRAETALGGSVSKAVVTVPAYFDDAQRQATRDAGRLAGLEVVRIVNEPTAAALAYGIGASGNAQGATPKTEGGGIALSVKVNPQACSSDAAPGHQPQATGHFSETVAVYDLGGGTFDISILHLQQTDDGVIDQVLATSGDTHLGGDDVDRMLVELIQTEIREQFGQSISFPPATRQAFRHFAEATKIRLSSDEQASIEVDLGEGRTYRRVLTREQLQAMIAPWVERTLDRCRDALRQAQLERGQIDRVVLVGGSTRIPAVQRAVGELFQIEPYTALNPDEVVALGAAVQASILAGGRRDLLLLDVIPLSLGIETMGGAVAKLIVANQTIPARASEMFSTYVDGQTNVKIHVVQGERETVEHCRSLGEFELRGIPPMPAGLPKVSVTFLVDANGILSVQAIEERSGKRAAIQVIPNHGLTRAEVEQIEAESFAHAREDMNRHRLIDLRLNAKLDIRNIRKQLERVAEEIDPAYQQAIEDHVHRVQQFLETPDEQLDADAFHQAMTDMDHATVRLAELNIARTLKEDA